MAKARRQHPLRCQTHYLPDRHVLQKMLQVYRWLVPEPEPGNAHRAPDLIAAHDEKDRRHLRSSLF